VAAPPVHAKEKGKTAFCPALTFHRYAGPERNQALNGFFDEWQKEPLLGRQRLFLMNVLKRKATQLAALP